MNEVRRRIVTWPAWLDGQKAAGAGVVIAFAAFLQIGFSGMRSDMNQLRGDMNQQISELRGDMNRQISDLRGDLGQFRADVEVRLRAIEIQLAVVDTRLSAVERYVGIDGPSQKVADAGQESRQTPY